jgi:hypothetical protein
MNKQEERLEFLSVFYKYLEDNELEVQNAALFSLRVCCKYIPSDHIEKEIIPRINEYFLRPLAATPPSTQPLNGVNQMPININGPSDIVIKNQVLAQNLMYIGSYMNPEAVKRSLLPVFENLLNSNHPNVRIKLFENYNKLAVIFGSTALLDIIKKEFNKFVIDSNWRIRKQGFKMIENFGKKFVDVIFEDSDFVSKIHEGLSDKVGFYFCFGLM